MSDLFGNHIVGFPTRRLIYLSDSSWEMSLIAFVRFLQDKRFHIPNMTLRGSEATSARFGSAISGLGDINADGFGGKIEYYI